MLQCFLKSTEYVEAGPSDPEVVAFKTEEFIEVVEVISTLSNQDFNHTVTANLEVLQRFSGSRAHHTQGPGRLAFDMQFWSIKFFVFLKTLNLCQFTSPTEQ